MRWLLALFPRRMRERFGADILASQRELVRAAAARGRLAALRCRIHCALDIVVAALGERRFEMKVVRYGLAICIGLAIGWIDLHSRAVQGPALAVLLGAGLFAAVDPGAAWRWALAVGLGIPAAHLVWRGLGQPPPYPVEPGLAATLLALVPAAIGAYGGAFLRRTSAEG